MGDPILANSRCLRAPLVAPPSLRVTGREAHAAGVMTRPTLRLVAALAAIAALVVVAVPVLGVDPSRGPSTGTAPTAAPPSASPSATPAAAPGASASPSDDGQGDDHGKPDKAAKPGQDQDATEHPVTLSGTVGKAAGEDGEFTLTVGSTVYTLDAGPKWWWGDASPLAAAVGKHVTIAGEQEDGSTNVDVLAIDGKQLRPAGRPPWAGGWKVVGPKHPGWAQWKVDKHAGKVSGRDTAPGQQSKPSPTP